MGMGSWRWWAAAAAIAACGSDDGPARPQPLADDPAVSTGCLPDPVPAGAARAKRIACAEEVPRGMLASGRIGDIVIENARIEVVIRGFGEGFVFPGTYAGGIVDAAPVGGEDLIKEIQPLVELNAGAFDEFAIVEAGDDGPAEVAVRGPAFVIPFLDAAIAAPPLDATIEVRYRLEPDSDALHIRTTVFGADGATGLVQHGEGLFFGGRATLMIPGRGFVAGAGASGPFIASAGPTTSYAVVHDPAVQAVQLIDIGGIALSIGPTSRLEDPQPVDRWLVVGDGSPASVTERAWRLRGVATGTLSGTTAPGAAIAVEAGGALVTRGRSGADGAFRIAVPPGDYTVRAESIDRDPPTRAAGPDVVATVRDGADTPVSLSAGGTGAIVVAVADDGGAPLPARVVATAPGFRRIDWSGADGNATLALPPGTYDVTVSRGMEYDAFVATGVDVADGDSVAIRAILERVVDTDGWIAVDPHLHSEMSSDSSFPLDLRLRAVAAEGIEVAISTDHDFVTDYAPVIDALGLSPWLTSRVGEEISSIVWGHINAWPLPADPDRAAGGAIHWYGVSPGEVMARARAGNSARVVQLNHPRNGAQSGVFDAIDFDPVGFTARTDPRDLGLPPDTDLSVLDFDAIEIANSFNAEDFAEGWADWMSLIAHGHPAAATGSSDSHGASAYAGHSRTYVYVGPGRDDPAAVDLDEVDANLKARRAVVAQGAFVVAGIPLPDGRESLPGDLVDVAGRSDVPVHIRVQAPPWMPLSRIRVYAGGDAVAATIALDPADTAAVRYDGTVSVPLAGADTFVVVRVDPAGAGAPVLGTPDASFTNPLLIDADGDGMWTPPVSR